MRYLVTLICWLCAVAAQAQEWEDRQTFNAEAAGATLRVLSSTDTDLFAPIIEDFVRRNPTTSFEYFVTGTADIDRVFRAAPQDFDIVISSAMDLQLRLTNDGFALPLENVTHPAWAQWRNSLFAFTSEPAAIVINKAAFRGHPIPRSRQDLIVAMRERPEVFHNRVGTYDVRRSGLGYLFATQDSRASETYWRLMEVMGGATAKLYCCSGDMIDDLTDGTIAVAYNVLESYAEARIENGDVFEIIDLSDFRTTMMRTVLVSRATRQPDAAARFIDELVSAQRDSTTQAPSLPVLSVENDGQEQGTIQLEPGLLTFLDQAKRRKFLQEWENALIQD